MVVEDGKIVKATNDELFEYWMQRYDDVFTYEQFKLGCMANGTLIVQEVCDERSDRQKI